MRKNAPIARDTRVAIARRPTLLARLQVMERTTLGLASGTRACLWSLAIALLLGAPSRGRGEDELPGTSVEGYPECVRAIEPPRAAVSFASSEPAARAGRRVLTTLAAVRASLRETRYEHVTRVHARRGVYLWDCSGMAAWVLQRAAPRALSALGDGRPVARDFYRAIARAPLNRPRRGWQRLGSIADARPGDVVAWLRPDGWSSPSTGHVAFLVEQPAEVPGHPGAWAVRIADATSFGHQDDSRPQGSGGYGEGTLLVLTASDGRAIAYGWYGTQSDAVLMTSILFGRLAD